MRGEKELENLNYVRANFSKIIHEKIDSSELEFIKNKIFLAKPNENKSLFPDFLFFRGFIEHFQVSTSKDMSKGFAHKRVEYEYEKTREERFQSHKDEILPKIKPGQIAVRDDYMESPEYKYDYYYLSLEKHFKKHIESLKKYTGNKEVGIFLIENIGACLSVNKNNCYLESYRMTLDKKVLSFLYQYKSNLEYVIYSSAGLNEIIKLKAIPDIIAHIPSDICFVPGRYVSVTNNVILDIDVIQNLINKKPLKYI